MVSVMRSCIQSILKLVNCLIGMVGIAMVLYSIWLIRVWEREMGGFPFFEDDDDVTPWFIYTFLGLGVTLSVITCFGHIAAETANGCCLYLYMLFIFLLLMLEAGVTADVFLNRDWEEACSLTKKSLFDSHLMDFPKDPSGSFDQFKGFVRSNFELCKWTGLSIVSVQAIGPHPSYDSDDDYASDRAPLLKDVVHPPSYVVGNPVMGSRNNAWSIRVSEKRWWWCAGGVAVVIGGAVYFLERPFWPTMQLLGLHVVVFLKCFLVVFGQQYHTHHNVADLHWKPATATWYGSPDGDGSDGGACGYGSLVDVKPLRARVGAVSPILFKNGEGCGACYKVRCLDKSICSERAVTIIVTDECPGGYCSNGHTHFDLSGAAFGHMAISGENGQLRNRGEIPVIYRRYGGLVFLSVCYLQKVFLFPLSSLS
ncbi:hypothetical protein NC653_031637 [Populus alba x Populus x berolinensis]|uniref:Expansin-like EG45 domain-containing protein n=1 Tax=Populus alba x Populus x berolinensis TaxID=444605 RepID=A0AAD6LZ23_9ROSI|nr:hypothetical protein NC653_031637 [Populus alba x Populus x berolinensis]